MSIHYLDPSAWIKRYFVEPGSPEGRRLFDTNTPMARCRFGLVELTAAMSRRATGARIDPARIASQIQLARRDYGQFAHVDVTEELWNLAETHAPRHHLRGADAIHLAAVIILAAGRSDSVTVVSSDLELLAAAQAESLPILNPAQQT